MIHLPASVRVYLCLSPCDMRRSFDGLHGLVTGAMQMDAFGGHLFVFANRRRDRVKRDGFAIWAKRLEEGTYAMPFGEESEQRREITAQEPILASCSHPVWQTTRTVFTFRLPTLPIPSPRRSKSS
jgi:transposase